MAKLEELIARRTDLGTFVVHLTKDSENTSAKENLLTIVRARKLEARNPFGSAVSPLTIAITENKADIPDLLSQHAVCFTETPLEYIHLMLAHIEDVMRACNFAPYGFAITKKLARKKNVNPIWYIDITPGHNWLINPINTLIEEAINNGDFANSPIAKLTPLIEQMGSNAGQYRKEFWWEREWRHKGNFNLPSTIILLCPEEEHAEFVHIANEAGIRATAIDAKWGLEAIIARLGGFSAEDIGPF